MPNPQEGIRLYYKNVTADILGPEHGLTAEELDELTGRVGEIVRAVEAERAHGEHRYRDLPYDCDMLDTLEEHRERYSGKCETLVVCGIGGSALGNIALQTALNPFTYNLLPPETRGGPQLFVMDNIDPMQFGALLDLLADRLDSTLFNVISKSGETAETAAQFLIVRDLLRQRLGPEGPKRHILVTTDKTKGTMRQIVNAEGYDSLPVPDEVGGRFSVLSTVGLFSAGMCGIDVARLLAGACAMEERIREPELRANPAALIAGIHYLMCRRGKRLHAMMPYSHNLEDLADWYRQLWAESLGKQKSLDGEDVFVGPTPIKALGATDQHSQVQLYREGPNDKVFTLLAVDAFDREMPMPTADGPVEAMAYLGGQDMGTLLNNERLATEQSLIDSERPTLTVRFPRITPETVGQFVYLYEAATTIAGKLFNINPYDQPAVELGKEYTFALMGRKGYEHIAKQLKGKLDDDSAYLVPPPS